MYKLYFLRIIVGYEYISDTDIFNFVKNLYQNLQFDYKK